MNPFATPEMAAGYASARPPVHEQILSRAVARLDAARKFIHGLDAGCGSGVSTRAMAQFAERCTGIDPVEAMTRAARWVAPNARFITGSGEQLPFEASTFDPLTAAGSLNYLQCELFFSEARRVISPGGVLIVYDFETARGSREPSGLEEWFEQFIARYPWPQGDARPLSPEILAQMDTGFDVIARDHFEIPLAMERGSYLNYMLTETNVARAVREGVPLTDIRAWCDEGLRRIWPDETLQVLFRGYYACMRINESRRSRTK